MCDYGLLSFIKAWFPFLRSYLKSSLRLAGLHTPILLSNIHGPHWAFPADSRWVTCLKLNIVLTSCALQLVVISTSDVMAQASACHSNINKPAVGLPCLDADLGSWSPPSSTSPSFGALYTFRAQPPSQSHRNWWNESHWFWESRIKQRWIVLPETWLHIW